MSTKVNLLDCSQEPSDEQLEALMQSVAVEACAKATVANIALMHTLHRQAVEVRSRYHLSYDQSVAAQVD